MAVCKLLYQEYMQDKRTISNEARILDRYGMKSAALFYINKNETLLRRTAQVFRCTLEETSLPPYRGGPLYPAGGWAPAIPGDDADHCGLRISYSGRPIFIDNTFSALAQKLEDSFEKILLANIARDMNVYGLSPMASRYVHGGEHWVMNHARILREGLNGYRERILQHLSVTRTGEKSRFYESMLDVAEGMICLAGKMAEHLNCEYERNQTADIERLVQAFRQVPVNPARNFFEAIVCTQVFMGYLTSSEPGQMDQYLYPYYAQDLSRGRITREEASSLLEAVIADVDLRVGSPGAWHMTLGGSKPDGKAGYNELTEILLGLMRKYRQPNTSLKVRPDMPEKLWDLALGNLIHGSGNPALINEEAYQRGFKEYMNMPEEDRAGIGFGGCTETLITGKSNVNSIGSMFNLADVLEQSTAAHLLKCPDFESFYAMYLADLNTCVQEMADQVNARQHLAGVYKTWPDRTFLTDDCIDQANEYYAGGARYNFENTSIYGLANAVNALYVIQQVYQDKAGISQADLLGMLQEENQSSDEIRRKIRQLPKFGCDDPALNGLARNLMEHVFTRMKQNRIWRGNGYFTPSIIGWTTFVRAGRMTGATADGRVKGEALADSTGPMQGTDRDGPTSLLLAAASIPQYEGVGTCVLNLMFDRKYLEHDADREKVIALLKTYFKLGGIQVQINVLSEKDLEKAMADPDKYGSLTVRIAGYNDYFVRQSRDIQEEILKRTRIGQ